ncbi:uncharacterized protein L3040_001714 [Drepanopeziza brunnea f. sp. 'multigermtubi']|uniref:uncharacterized protein n=1 Tax=Drepanopeziza brunnea f. sp. 'multigermtubi' TaxID=698441 RepID=UPI002393951C|nr:hypothetical protein L3040_001714 [Drepanopeziza brunnea f. sp. 'multigermtubi']
MTRGFYNYLAAALALASFPLASFAQENECGGGEPEATVTGEGNSYTATSLSKEVYSGSDYLAAITAALDSISEGQRVSVIASGSIGTGRIHVDSGKIFEGCGTIDIGNNKRGSIESLNTVGASIPFLTLTGSPYFGMRFYGTHGLSLGRITMRLSGGMGIRFDRDEAPNTDVQMDVIDVKGAGSHAVETWNIDGLTINEVLAEDVGECGLLLQATTNAKVGLVKGTNVATGNGYATFRMANRNGRSGDDYSTNIFIDEVIATGGGRGIFCVSESGGAEIRKIDISNTGGDSILIENCHNVNILGGVVTGGGNVRLAKRNEFENNSDISLNIEVNDTPVLEKPCGENSRLEISGNADVKIC